MNDAPAIMDQAIQALKEQRPQEAADLLKDHIWRDPSDGAAYAFLGVALSELGDSASALEALERAHYLAPQDAGILYNYGLVLEAAGRSKEARIRFSAALQLDPGYHRAQQRLLQLGGPFPPVPPGAGRSPQTEPEAPPPSLESGPAREMAEAAGIREPTMQPSSAASEVTGGKPPSESNPPPAADPEPAARPGIPQPMRKWIRERPAENGGEEGTPSEPRPAGTAASSPSSEPPAIADSPTPHAPPTPLSTAEDPSPVPGPPPPGAWLTAAPPPSDGTRSLLLTRGAELLQNRGVLAALCVLFTTGGLIIGIGIRGVMPGPAPRPLDPLQAAGLRRGNLSGKSLAGLDLSNVQLAGEKMPAVRGERVLFTGAKLAGADLHESKLPGVNLDKADLAKADLRRADLAGARLNEATLTGAFMRGAYLKAAVLRGANLQQAYLSAANLVRADLTSAILTDADLRGANLSEAILVDGILSNAQLQGANLYRARLERAVLKDARYDAKTRWPAGFNPRLRGAVSVSPPPPAATASAAPQAGSNP